MEKTNTSADYLSRCCILEDITDSPNKIESFFDMQKNLEEEGKNNNYSIMLKGFAIKVDNKNKIVIPNNCAQDCIKKVHEFFGHASVSKIY